MHELSWTEIAQRNLDDIGAHISLQNPLAAAQVLDEIVVQAERLILFPNSGRKGSVPGTRELIVRGTPFILVYRVREEVEILRVRHAAMRWPENG